MSGLRFGVSAATTRGLGAEAFEAVGDLIADVLEGLRKHPDDNGVAEQRTRARVSELMTAYPTYA
jgi:glycine hydroxymethyltransferase